MRKHLVTIILLVIAVVAFGMRFFVEEKWQDCCDIAAFALPTMAALVQIVISERSGKATNEKIQKLKEKQLSVRVEGEGLIFEEGIE